MKFAAAILISMLHATAALAVDCRNITYDGNGYTLCEVDPRKEELRLFLADKAGRPFGQFSAVNSGLAKQRQSLAFAMNAGMYHLNRSPVGHYVENRMETMRVVTSPGPGNFGLLPNGVFCIREDRADVIETLAFIRQSPKCVHATQSGPMLVIDGDLHQRFLPDSDSRFIRNGVGTSAIGDRVVFAISNNSVTFHEFGSLFRNYLKLPQALYFDGKVSRLYAPAVDRNDPGFAMGPIVGVVETRTGE